MTLCAVSSVHFNMLHEILVELLRLPQENEPKKEASKYNDDIFELGEQLGLIGSSKL